MLMELNVRAVTSLRVFCSSEGAMAASVVTNARVVAMLGWIMPAPLAQPTRWIRLPAILKEAAAVFGRVSVVQMASDTSANERAEERRWRASSGTARSILSSANGTPMTPVEQTNDFFRFATKALGSFGHGAHRSGMSRGASGAIGIARIYHNRAHTAFGGA